MSEHDATGVAADVATPGAAAPGAATAATPMLSGAAWARILPFATYVLFIVVGDVLERLGMSPAALRWLYAVRIGAVVLVLAFFWRHYSELRVARLPVDPGAARMHARLGRTGALGAVATGVLVLVLWISLNADWMTIGSSSGFDARTGGRIDWPLVLVRIAGAALVVPVIEELFWRSFLMRWIASPDFEKIDPAQVGLKGFIITVVLFGLEHNLWLAGIVAGAAYGLLYARHRSLWSPILAHAVTNGLLGVWVVYGGNWSYW
jgi:CAAX prenyl protease-like protein